ncbi:DUF3365 domain-containing protein [Magnetovibrio sp. PR-2]|uniref:Tll0287-like domain-containing protein n=1 Tax=Magnetovibrio sp. PR-2 TaxID=3120356 RepID=UPI002FCE45DE
MNNKLMIGALALGLLAANAVQAADANMDALKAEAKTVVMSFGGPLKKALGGAMKEGGPVNAIGVCNEKAPGIAMAAAKKSGWDVGRTSLKLRNPGNQPDAWELGVLKMFEDRKAKGEAANAIAYGEVVDMDGKKQFRFMKAIGTADVCLNCHGKTLKPEVAAKLDGLYPDDKARGFSAGDIRGAFTLRKDL